MRFDSYIAEVSTSEKELKQSCLIYGDSFTGKTTLAAQLARKYKLIWFDIDSSASRIRASVPQEFWENIEYFEIKDTPQTPVAAKTLAKFFTAKGKVKIFHEDGSINNPLLMKNPAATYTEIDVAALNTDTVIVVDSLTALSDSVMNHFLGGVGEMDFKSKEFKHYDHQGLLLNNIIVGAIRNPAHVVFISHQEELEQEDGSIKLTPTGGTRNFSRKLARKFDHVVHCKLHNRKHCYNSVTVQDHKVIAGSRYEIDVQDFDSFLNIFSGDKQEATKAKPGLSGLKK